MKEKSHYLANLASIELCDFKMDLIKGQFELRVVQFWSEIILVISNRTRPTRLFDSEIIGVISVQIALHTVQLPL